MLFKKCLLLLVLILCMGVAYADTSWFTWGNNGFRGAGVGVDNIIFGSNYPQGSTNMSNITKLESNDYIALVADWENDNQNEIFTFSGSTINIYHNDLSLVATKILNGSISGTPCFMNKPDNTGRLLLAVPVDSTNIQFYESSESGFENFKSIDTTDADNLLCGGGRLTDAIWSVDTGAERFFQHNVTDGTETKIWDLDANLEFCPDNADASTDNYQYSNPYVLDDYDSDGKVELLWIYGGADGVRPISLNVYEPYDKAYDLSNVTVSTGIGTCNSSEIAVGKVGSPSAPNQIIFRYQGSTETEIKMLDTSGTAVVSIADDLGGYKSFPVVADVDADSNNEMCFLWNNTNIFCYSSTSSSPKYQWTLKSDRNQKYFAIGEYDGSSSFQEIITPTMMYTPASASAGALNEVMNMTIGDGNELDIEAMVYPVSVEDITRFFKDVVIFDGDNLEVFDSQETPAVCGNGVCEIGESILTCQADCTPSAIRDVILSTITINPSTSGQWKNNTDVVVTALVKSKSSANVRANAILYLDSSFEDEKGYTEYASANSTFSFQFKANHTISNAILRVIGQSSLDNSTENLDFGFTVGLDGLEFGDSQFNFQNPDDPTPPEDDTTDPDDNAFTNFFDLFFGMTGLSSLVIWLIVMGIVGVGVVALCGYAKWSGIVSTAVLVIVEFILFVIGVLVQAIPIGVIIVFVLFAILIGALLLRKAVTGG